MSCEGACEPADGELGAVGKRDEAHELIDNLEGGLRRRQPRRRPPPRTRSARCSGGRTSPHGGADREEGGGRKERGSGGAGVDFDLGEMR
jgi:hypothetical protein